MIANQEISLRVITLKAEFDGECRVDGRLRGSMDSALRTRQAKAKYIDLSIDMDTDAQMISQAQSMKDTYGQHGWADRLASDVFQMAVIYGASYVVKILNEQG